MLFTVGCDGSENVKNNRWHNLLVKILHSPPDPLAFFLCHHSSPYTTWHHTSSMVSAWLALRSWGTCALYPLGALCCWELVKSSLHPSPFSSHPGHGRLLSAGLIHLTGTEASFFSLPTASLVSSLLIPSVPTASSTASVSAKPGLGEKYWQVSFLSVTF